MSTKMNISDKRKSSTNNLCRVCVKKCVALQNLNIKRNENNLLRLRSFCLIQVSFQTIFLNYLIN